MKKLIIVFLAMIMVTSVNAQILRSIARSAVNQAKNSAENRAEKEVDKKVDEEVNKSVDKMLESDSTDNKKSTQKASEDQDSVRASKFMTKLGISTKEVKHKDVYKFSSQIVMVMQATDSNGKKQDPGEYISCFDETTSDVSFVMGNQKDGSSTTIIDQENKCMLMLTDKDGKKTGFASKFDTDAKAKPATDEKPGTAQKSEPAEDDCKLTKTGKTQSISGYNCSEYRCENSEAISIAWVTKDFSSKNNKLFGNNAMGKSYKTEGLDGMVMQYETHSKKDKSSSIMTVKSIDMKKSSSFSTAGYEISNFSFTPKN
jgi:hypothetical protein